MFTFSIGNAFLVVIYDDLVLNKILFVHSFVVGGVGGVKRPAEDSKEEPSEKKNLPITAKTYIPKTHPVSSSVSSKVAQNRPPSHFIQNSSSNKHVSTAPTQQRAIEKNTVSENNKMASPSTESASTVKTPGRNAEKVQVPLVFTFVSGIIMKL